MAPAETIYLFRHAVLRDAAYQLQLPGDRARLHALALDVIAEAGDVPPALPDDLLGPARSAACSLDVAAEELADHARRGAEGADGKRARELRGREAVWRWRAAKAAESEGRNEEAGRRWARLAECPGLSAVQAAGAQAAAGAWLAPYDRAAAAGLLGRALRDAEARPAEGAAWRRVEIVVLDVTEQSAEGERRPRLERALRIAGEIGDRDLRARCLGNLAALEARSGQTDAAEVRYREVMAFYDETAQPAGRTKVLLHLSELFGSTGRLGASENAARAALELARSRRIRNQEAETLGRLAIVLVEQHRPAEAEPLCREALAAAHDIGDRAAEAKWLNTLGTVSLELGREEEARRCYQRAIDLALDLGGDTLTPMSNIAQLCLRQGDLPEAERLVLFVLDAARASGKHHLVGLSTGTLAQVLAKMGRAAEAEARFREVIEDSRRTGDRRREGIWLCNLADFLEERGRAGEARAAWDESEAVLAAIGADRLLAEVRRLREAGRKGADSST